MDTSKVHVAVIGAGPAGLAAIKSLMEEGFQVTGFERRPKAGGLWAFSENPEHTSATTGTRAQLSKFILPLSDYPAPDDFPRHPTAADMAVYYESYALHFGLLDKIIFNVTMDSVWRTDDDTKWAISIQGEDAPRLFDKVVSAAGSEVVRNDPVIAGLEIFDGRYLHGQAYKRAEDFSDMKVIVIGQGNSAADCAFELSSHASEVYWSHRRGAMVFPRMVNGERFDKFATWKMTRLAFLIGRIFPAIHRFVYDMFFSWIVWKSWGRLDPQWRLDRTPFYATTISGMVVSDDLVPALRAGSVISTTGVRRICGPHSVEFDDGSVIDNVDAIIACTGYRNSLHLLNGIVKYSHPHPAVLPMPDLYQGIFAVEHADSIACLNYAIVQDNAATCRELAALAVAQVWAGKSRLPPREQMEVQLQQHRDWFVKRTLECPLPQYQGTVEPDKWLRFVNDMAGTGVYERFGWTVQGFRFCLSEPSLYRLMAWGVNSPHIYRVFETGKRKAWPGAREAIRHINRMSDIDLGSTKVEKTWSTGPILGSTASMNAWSTMLKSESDTMLSKQDFWVQPQGDFGPSTLIPRNLKMSRRLPSQPEENPVTLSMTQATTQS
ncbi:hypothetical protein G7046_g550 [Stylonectria norvegica]|nr:hypothetical protein G7046_g550 [Stylonectria norvegica]